MLLTVTDTPADVEIQKQLTSIHIDEWLKEDVFHIRWWILLILLTALIFVWWKMIDKSILPEILLYATLTTIAVMAVVEYGEELTLWDYPTDIIPIFPPLSSINLVSLPLIYSLTYQHFKTWKSFLPASAIITGIICFVLEPLLVWAGFYQLLKWKYYFSYPIYLAAAIGVKAVSDKIMAVTENRNRREAR
jgi:hypothetical protein